jgi:MFS family permease
VLFALYAIAYIDKRLIALLVDPIRNSLGASDFQLSILTGSAFVIFHVLFTVPIGWAVDRFSRRAIIFAGVLTWSAFAALGGLTRSYLLLLISRFGVGAGEAVLGPAGNCIVAETVAPDKLTRAMAAFHAGAIAGSAIAFAAGGWLLELASTAKQVNLPPLGALEPWQLALLVTSVPGVLFAFLAFLIREPSRPASQKLLPPSSAARRAMESAWPVVKAHWTFYVPHFMGFALLSIAISGFAAWMPTHMLRTYALPVAALGSTLALMQLTFGVVGMFLPAWVIDRLFKAGRLDAHLRFYAGASLLMGAAGVLVGIAPSAKLALCGVAVIDMMVGFLPAAAAALLLTTPRECSGRITAVFLLVYNLVGQAVGPVIVAAMTDFGFADPLKVGKSLAILFAIAAPIAAIVLHAGQPAMRRIVLARQSSPRP